MQKQLLSRLLWIALLAMPLTPIRASIAVSAPEMRTELLQKTSGALAETSAKNHRTEKRLNRLNRLLAKTAAKPGADPDFSDPVEKWLWFGLIGLGAALLFALISIGLAGIVGFLAIVCLVIWVIKRQQAA